MASIVWAARGVLGLGRAHPPVVRERGSPWADAQGLDQHGVQPFHPARARGCL